MLIAVVVTTSAEAAVGLLLLLHLHLHLQRGLDLDVVSIALVFLPGAVVMCVLPPYLHRLVLRYGRARILAVASVSSALFAGSLAVAPNPLVIAALWILSGAARAAVNPVQQAVVAEASGDAVGAVRVGRAPRQPGRRAGRRRYDFHRRRRHSPSPRARRRPDQPMSTRQKRGP